jgi:hypothetical protein
MQFLYSTITHHDQLLHDLHLQTPPPPFSSVVKHTHATSPPFPCDRPPGILSQSISTNVDISCNDLTFLLYAKLAHTTTDFGLIFSARGYRMTFPRPPKLETSVGAFCQPFWVMQAVIALRASVQGACGTVGSKFKRDDVCLLKPAWATH